MNENEARLLHEVWRLFEPKMPEPPYLHNDIHLRDCPPDEPVNAHSHLIAMLLGSTEAIPVANGELVPGAWQSVLRVELDGSRHRRLMVQL